jgi:hypothetical protein
MDVGCVLGYEVASGVRWSDRAANEIHSQSGASTGMCEERRGNLGLMLMQGIVICPS